MAIFGIKTSPKNITNKEHLWQVILEEWANIPTKICRYYNYKKINYN